MIPGSANPLLLKSAAAAGGYQIERSLRFNSADSAYLSRTPAVAGNRRTWTWAAWVKRSALGAAQFFFCAGPDTPNDTDQIIIFFQANDTIRINTQNTVLRETTQVFRDPSSWYHFVVAFDTTIASPANDRVKLYINGSQVTTFNITANPTQNANTGVNSAALHTLGKNSGSPDYYFSGYLADIHFIDGQALDATAFTEVSATTGQLIPKAYAGTYTGNSFWLKFNDNSAATAATLGNDYSGNNNDWTPNNLQTTTGGPTSVAAASGALPIYNTTDTYGATKGSGTRTDSNSSSIVLAIPMDGANNGTTFTDESATIRGSGSAISISRNVATTTTSFSKYYGSSGNFNGASDYLNLGTGVPTDLQIGQGDFCIEFWWYPTSTASNQHIYGNLVNSNGSGHVWIVANNSFSVGSTITFGNGTTNLFFGSFSNKVPVNQWNHIAITRSSTSVRCFLNGAQLGSAQTLANWTGNTTNQLRIGQAPDGTYEMDGYLQDFRVYKGVAKYTSNFIPPNNPQSAALIGAGNDSLVDTPTSYGTDTSGVGGVVRGNYATLNPLNNGGIALSNGNLDWAGNGAGTKVSYGTVAVSSGKWYFEASINGATGGVNWECGIARVGTANNSRPGATANGWQVDSSGSTILYKRNNNSATSIYSSGLSNGDILGVAFDVDNGRIWFARNGTWLEGSPSAGTGASFTNVSGTVAPFGGSDGSGPSSAMNFGQRPFAYTAPSGFKALCDTNLPAPVVAKSSDYFQTLLYTGTGSSQSIIGLNFSPDLVWIKNRTSGGSSPALFDVVRGADKRLRSNGTDSELSPAIYGSLTAFNSNGFTVAPGSDAIDPAIETCKASNAYVAWTWDAGTSTVTNTQGSITSQVRANASAGFSVVTYTGTGANATVGHGLGVAPTFVIYKNRDVSSNWIVYHKSLGNNSFGIMLNSTAAYFNDSTPFNNTAPTSTVLHVGTNYQTNENTRKIVAYAFAPVVGYSSFGSYTGNGSTDGPFVYTGFRPRWVMIKATGGSTGDENWMIKDALRPAYNPTDGNLYANQSFAEDSVSTVITDLVSNGFKIRGTYAGVNTSAVTYIYCAFAESSLQYARAR